jgi:hypothetical protein
MLKTHSGNVSGHQTIKEAMTGVCENMKEAIVEEESM